MMIDDDDDDGSDDFYEADVLAPCCDTMCYYHTIDFALNKSHLYVEI